MRRARRFFPASAILVVCGLAAALAACGRTRPPAAPAAVSRPAETAAADPLAAWAPGAVAPAGRVRAVVDAEALETIVRMIDGAETTVAIAVFEGTAFDATTRIADAVRRATARGVRVRVLLDDEPLPNKDLLHIFRTAGAEAAFDAPEVRTHAKMVVVDRRAALVGSTNWSEWALTKNHEANLLLENPVLAAFLDDYLEEIRLRPRARVRTEGPAAPEATPVVDARILPALLRVIEGARGRIDAIVHATSETGRRGEGSPLEALVVAAKAGVRVRVIFERTDRRGAQFVNDLNERAAEPLRAAGADVRWDPAARTTHAKVVVADTEAIVSSANWSTSSLDRNHESGAVVRDLETIADLRRYFDSIWRESSSE